MEEVTKYGKELLEKEKENAILMEQIKNNSEYITWLCHFLNKHSNFSDDGFSEFDDISEKDLLNVHNLGLFYNVVNKYAQDNYIIPDTFKYGSSYNVKYGDAFLEIGLMTGQACYYYSKVADRNDKDYFIDYDDIINDRELASTKTINRGMEELTDVILCIYGTGVSIEAIKERFNEVLSNLHDKGKPINRSLVKKVERQR